MGRGKYRIVTAAILALALLAPARASCAGSFWDELNPFKGRSPSPFILSFYNLHTLEKLDVEYRTDDGYHVAALAQINGFLRDYRTGDTRQMDAGLLDLLYNLKTTLETRHPGLHVTYEVISGYRSEHTNYLLRLMGGSQAKDSQHIQGKAIDIRIPGVPLTELRDTAWCLQRGGVGYYESDGFVHVDTARIRFWNWDPASSSPACTAYGYKVAAR